MPKVIAPELHVGRAPDQASKYSLVNLDPDNTGKEREYIMEWGVLTDLRHGWYAGSKGLVYYVTPSVRLLNAEGTILDKERINVGYYDIDSDTIGDPDPDKPDLWFPFFWFLSGLGLSDAQGSVSPELIDLFFNKILPTKQIDPEGEHTPECALAGVVVHVGVTHLPFTRKAANAAGELDGKRNAIGFGVRQVGTKFYPNGGWRFPALDAAPEHVKLGITYGPDTICPNVLFRSEDDQFRFWDLLEAGPAPLDNDNPFG